MFVAFFFVDQLQTIGFCSAFVHFLRSLDDLPAHGMPFVGAKEAIGLYAALPEAVEMQGFQEVGKGPDVDTVRDPHAPRTGVREDSALQVGQGRDGAESGKLPIVVVGCCRLTSPSRYA